MHVTHTQQEGNHFVFCDLYLRHQLLDQKRTDLTNELTVLLLVGEACANAAEPVPVHVCLMLHNKAHQNHTCSVHSYVAPFDVAHTCACTHAFLHATLQCFACVSGSATAIVC